MAQTTATAGTILAAMPDNEHELWEYAARNRADIDTHRDEIQRLRARTHELAAQVAGQRYLGEQVAELVVAVKAQGEELAKISRRALTRPTVPLVMVWLQVVTTVTAILAIATALSK